MATPLVAAIAIAVASMRVLVLTSPIVPLWGRRSDSESGSKNKCGSHAGGLSLSSTTGLSRKNRKRQLRKMYEASGNALLFVGLEANVFR